MLQRIQSIFLVGVVICMTLTPFFDIWSRINQDQSEEIILTAISVDRIQIINEVAILVDSQQVIYLIILSTLVSIVAVYSIFRYDNRLTQMKLGAINSLIMAALLGGVMYNIYTQKSLMEVTDQEYYGISFYVIIVALLLNIAANRFIRRDEKTVREADRLR